MTARKQSTEQSGSRNRRTGKHPGVINTGEPSAAGKGDRQFFRALVDNSSSVMFVKDLDGRYLFVNRSYAQMFHVDRKKIKSMTDYDLFPKEIADRYRENDIAVIQARKELHWEEVVPLEDGLHTFVAVKFPIFDAKKKVQAVGCISSIDVTNWKRMEEELRESEERFRTIFHAAPGMTTISTLDEGRYVDVNEAGVHFIGHAREDMIGHTVSELSIWAYPEERKSFLRILRREGRLHEARISIRTRTGEIRDVLWSAVIIKAGGRDMVLSLFQDVGALRQALEKPKNGHRRRSAIPRLQRV